MTKRLNLKRESLAELTMEELQGAVGGLSGPTCNGGVTCAVLDCVSDRIVGCANLTTGCTA